MAFVAGVGGLVVQRQPAHRRLQARLGGHVVGLAEVDVGFAEAAFVGDVQGEIVGRFDADRGRFVGRGGPCELCEDVLGVAETPILVAAEGFFPKAVDAVGLVFHQGGQFADVTGDLRDAGVLLGDGGRLGDRAGHELQTRREDVGDRRHAFGDHLALPSLGRQHHIVELVGHRLARRRRGAGKADGRAGLGGRAARPRR